MAYTPFPAVPRGDDDGGGGGGGVALGETSSTAYRGDRGKTGYDHSQVTGNPHGTTAADVGAAAASHTHAGTYAPATRTVGTSLGTSGTVDLDMASVNDTVQWVTATGALTFTTSNRAAGRSVTLVIDAGGSSRTLTWPSWIPGGAALPTTLASGKRLIVSVMFLDTTDTAASAAAAVQP